ncbi:hypothetical protein KOR42_48230 [Thalassoglobus neptunius]|uniref:Uncharacterized protein n=1 Tax=Thalassoglobus neptunius TaxID=1938619 RepID=A0A5C5VT51_9PLAN|nr:hypothetical protein KOR42_48230 [Thalassoglobus neptunius]
MFNGLLRLCNLAAVSVHPTMLAISLAWWRRNRENTTNDLVLREWANLRRHASFPKWEQCLVADQRNFCRQFFLRSRSVPHPPQPVTPPRVVLGRDHPRTESPETVGDSFLRSDRAFLSDHGFAAHATPETSIPSGEPRTLLLRRNLMAA